MANSKTSVTYLGQVLWIQEHTICLSTQIYLSYFYIHYNIAPPTYFVLYMLQLSSRVSNNWSCFFRKIYNNDLNYCNACADNTVLENSIIVSSHLKCCLFSELSRLNFGFYCKINIERNSWFWRQPGHAFHYFYLAVK